MILIPGEKGYSHAHYGYNDDDPRRPASCGLATPSGETCRWPVEPGTPWCNAHTCRFLASAKSAGYVDSAQIRWLAAQTSLSAEFTDVLVRRWERDYAPLAPPREAVQKAPVAEPAAPARVEAPSLLTGTWCAVCAEPQIDSPSGVTCRNGHGGAEGLASIPVLGEQDAPTTTARKQRRL